MLKKFISLKWAFIFLISFGVLTSVYWRVFMYPYLWIYSGRINAASLHIRSPEEGILTQLPLHPGDRIDKGALLFSLENSRMIEKQKNTKRSLSDLHKELVFYKSQSEEAMQNYLSDLGVRSQHEVDQHLQTLHSAQLKVNQIQEQTQALLEEERQIEQYQTKLSTASPCEGILLRHQKTVGDFVQTGESIVTVFDLSSCWIEVKAPEKTLHLLQVGQEVDIYLTAYPNQSWKGSVSWIGPATISQLQGSFLPAAEETIPVKISIFQENFPLKPGLSATVRIKKNITENY